jgi:hypothetical protein
LLDALSDTLGYFLYWVNTNSPDGFWSAVTISSNGTKIVACIVNVKIYRYYNVTGTLDLADIFEPLSGPPVLYDTEFRVETYPSLPSNSDLSAIFEPLASGPAIWFDTEYIVNTGGFPLNTDLSAIFAEKI